MEENVTNLAAAIALIEIPSVLWAGWSFKMHKDMFGATAGGSDSVSFKGNGLLEHTGSTIFGAGVCPLGKFGAWFILAWTIIMLFLIIKYSRKTPSQAHKAFRAIGITHAVIMAIIAVLSAIMNYPLFLRTMPYYVVQAGVATLLIGQKVDQCKAYK